LFAAVQLEVKREVDIFMSGYLKEEAIGKDKAELFAVTFEELNELEVRWPRPPRDVLPRRRGGADWWAVGWRVWEWDCAVIQVFEQRGRRSQGMAVLGYFRVCVPRF
jgi:hypothetical protein